MNGKIVITFLREHQVKCRNRSVSNLTGPDRRCTFCHDINRDMLLLVSRLEGARKSLDVGLALSPLSGHEPYDPYRRAGFKIFRQKGDKEHEQIHGILLDAFDRGYGTVVILAHSVPNIPPAFIEQALDKLQGGEDIVLGPLLNGGFYLIGVQAAAYHAIVRKGPDEGFCFENNGCRKAMLANIKEVCERHSVLSPWYIIKSYEDLKRMHLDIGKGIGFNAKWTGCFAREIVGTEIPKHELSAN